MTVLFPKRSELTQKDLIKILNSLNIPSTFFTNLNNLWEIFQKYVIKCYGLNYFLEGIHIGKLFKNPNSPYYLETFPKSSEFSYFDLRNTLNELGVNCEVRCRYCNTNGLAMCDPTSFDLWRFFYDKVIEFYGFDYFLEGRDISKIFPNKESEKEFNKLIKSIEDLNLSEDESVLV